MKFGTAATILACSLASVSAFVPAQSSWGVETTALFSAVEATEAVEAAVEAPSSSGALSGADIKARLEAQLEKLREKDTKSPKLSKEVSDG